MDIVKVKDPKIEKYEEILFRRDNLEKEAEQLQWEFIRVFGDLATESFRLKIECIKKKKMIAYCQSLVNRACPIIKGELDSYIEKEMTDYRNELRDMLIDLETAKLGRRISDGELRKIKKIYYRIVKLIHPDMHPELKGDYTIDMIWGKIVLCYRHNDLDGIREAELVLKSYLESKGLGTFDIKIDDIDSRIEKVEKRITEILSTNPYLYKFLLEDPDAVRDKTASYKNEIESFKRYSVQLDEVLGNFKIEEMLS